MHIVLGLLQAFIALTALAGGFMFVKDPSGAAMGYTVSMLEGSIFPDFLVPGLFLFVVNGLGSLIGAVLSFIKNRNAGPAAIALGVILVAWIVIQVSIIRSTHWLQGVYFALGLVELVLGMLVRRRQEKAA
jgi:hypothetical protein